MVGTRRISRTEGLGCGKHGSLPSLDVGRLSNRRTGCSSPPISDSSDSDIPAVAKRGGGDTLPTHRAPPRSRQSYCLLSDRGQTPSTLVQGAQHTFCLASAGDEPGELPPENVHLEAKLSFRDKGDGPFEQAVEISSEDNTVVQIVPVREGPAELVVKCNGRALRGSPFRVTVKPANWIWSQLTKAPAEGPADRFTPIYGEINQSGVGKILQWWKERGNLGPDSVVLEAGSGRGKPCFEAKLKYGAGTVVSGSCPCLRVKYYNALLSICRAANLTMWIIIDWR